MTATEPPIRPADLSRNELVESLSPAVAAAVRSGIAGAHRYPDPASTTLVGRLAERHDTDRSRIVVGPGSSALFRDLVGATCRAGDEVVLPWRSFEAYPALVAMAGTGARVRTVALSDDGRIDLPAMTAAVSPRTRVVVLCTPNNPTGTVLSDDEIEAFAASVPDHVVVLVDEAYVDFVHPCRRHDTAALATRARQRAGGRLAALRTFSKAYGLAGLRVGYLVADERLCSDVRQVSLPFGVGSLAQAAAAAALDDFSVLDRRRRIASAERARVRHALTALGLAVPDSEANFLWLPLPDTADAVESTCAAAGVLVRAYSGEGVRVTIGSREDDDLLLATLRRCLS